MIDPEVTAWCPRGDHADSGLLRCFGGADGVAFGATPYFGSGWSPPGCGPLVVAIWAGARLVTMRTPRLNRFDSATPASYLVFHMLLRTLQIPPGFVKPCLPTPPSVPRRGWLDSR